MADISIVYATRFGATERIARQFSAGCTTAGTRTNLISIADQPDYVPAQATVVLTSIIWDRPIPPMRNWIADHMSDLKEHAIACGVVCGSAGVREEGGMVYARHLAKRMGLPELKRFAFSGEVPPRSEMNSWEWWMLKAFTTLARKPELFDISADEAKARLDGETLAGIVSDS